jgi:alkaline phosphatase D
MSMRITRRQALIGVSALLVAPSCSRRTEQPSSGGANFAHGVASGDPDADSVVLWTRVTTGAPEVDGRWEVAVDDSFRNVVSSGNFVTTPERDFTVKVLADRLAPGARYYYRFLVDDTTSMTGRTRTLPTGHVERLGLALASCSNFPFGFFNAYEVIAQDDEVDYVLHLGDYIYEYGPDGYGGPTGEMIGRIHEPRKEIVTLEDYRTRHAQYKADAGSVAMHAAHPLIPIWDDHESANNPWMQGAENHQPEREGDWNDRKHASLRAYYEWMPVREPATGGSREAYWRHLRFGDLASLITLETRHTGRAKQIEYVDHIDAINTTDDAQAFVSDVLGAPDRRMISKEMEQFTDDAIRESLVENRPWRLIGNQIPMARTHVPPLHDPLFAERKTDETDPVAAELAKLNKMGELRLPIYLDTWDGYGWAREKFYDLAKDAGATDLLVLTGDSHSFWSNALHDESGRPMGLEVGTTGITSPGDFVAFGDEGAAKMDELLAKYNDEVLWTDGQHPGYVRLIMDRESARADYVTVTDILSKDYRPYVLKSMAIEKRDGTLVFRES